MDEADHTRAIGILLVLCLLGCDTSPQAAQTTLHNFSQPGLWQGNLVAPKEGELWVANYTDTLTVYDKEGRVLSHTPLTLPEEEGQAQWHALFWQKDSLILRNFADGKLWRYDPAAGILEDIPETVQCAWYFVVGEDLYFAKMLGSTLYVLRQDGRLETLCDHLSNQVQDLSPTDTHLYFCDQDSHQLFRLALNSGEETQLTSVPVTAPVVDGETYYYHTDAGIVPEQGIPASATRLYKALNGKLFYATADHGLVSWDGAQETILEEDLILHLELGDTWLYYQTQTGNDHLICN